LFLIVILCVGYIASSWIGSCHCVEMRDNERGECEKRLKDLEELIRHEVLQVEAKQSACGQFH